jgi:hypothetical protein
VGSLQRVASQHGLSTTEGEGRERERGKRERRERRER